MTNPSLLRIGARGGAVQDAQKLMQGVPALTYQLFQK